MVKTVNFKSRIFYHNKTHIRDIYTNQRYLLFYKKKIISRRTRMLLTHQHTLNPGENSTREAVMDLENELMVGGGKGGGKG